MFPLKFWPDLWRPEGHNMSQNREMQLSYVHNGWCDFQCRSYTLQPVFYEHCFFTESPIHYYLTSHKSWVTLLSGGTEHRSCCTGLETMTREWTCGLWAASWGRWSTTVLYSPGRMTLISWGWSSDTWAPPINMCGLECLSSLTTARWAHPHTWSHYLFWLF